MSARAQIQHEFFDRFMLSQYHDPTDRMAETRPHLERLLRHARDHVPFYRDRLAPVFDGRDGFDWDRWRDVPVLTRQDLLHHRADMQATVLPRYQGGILTDTTTGSTGPPVTISRSVYSADVLAAVLYRGRSWHQVDWRGDVLNWIDDGTLDRPPPEGVVGPMWGPPWLSESTGRSRTFNRSLDAAEILDRIDGLRPAYLSCRPTNAQHLALEALRLGRRSELKAVFGYSTAVLPQEREDCMAAFGAAIIGQYASKEAQNIAYQCPSGDHYHVNEEAVLVEVLDGNDQSVHEGEMGRLVVTNIFNLAQPIIRYDQGDLAVLGGTSCKCGRTLKVLERIVGRHTDLFRFPDGRVIAPVVPKGLRKLLDAQYWQIAQTQPMSVEVRYVSSGISTATAAALDAVKRLVKERTHPDAEVTIRRVDELPRGPGGKFVEVVCELAKD